MISRKIIQGQVHIIHMYDDVINMFFMTEYLTHCISNDKKTKLPSCYIVSTILEV